MVNCGSCGKSAPDGIQCTNCQQFLHYQCSGITEQGYRRLGERRAMWKCSSCKIEQQSTGPEGSSLKANLTLSDIMQELHKLNEKFLPLLGLAEDIRGIKSDVAELKSLSATNSTQISDIKGRLTKVEESQESVKARSSSLEDDLNAKDQWMRMNNAEIKGVPMTDKENLLDIVISIGAKIMFPITKDKINYVTRVPTRNNSGSGPKPIIVSFVNRYIKEDYVAASRLLKTLCPSDINLRGTSRIYVNDHLTVQNKMLLNKAKSLAKENNFQFVWVRNSKIFVRKDALNAPKIAIITEKDLQKII